MRLARFGTTLLALAAFGCATPLELDTDAWLEIRTPSFVLRGNLDADQMHELARGLALFDAVVRKVTNTRVRDSAPPVQFFALGDPGEARSLMPRGAVGAIYPRLSGYYSVLMGSSMVDARVVLLHEYAHYVLQGERVAPYPRWYEEGLCEYLARIGLHDDVIVIGRSATMRLGELRRGGPIPLAKLFASDGKGRGNRTFYATSWALAHHVNTSPGLNGQLRAFVARLMRGEPWEPAFDASFEPSLAELEASLADHIDFLHRGGRRDFHLPTSAVSVHDAFQVDELPPAEAAYQLGMLVRRMWETDPHPMATLGARNLFAQAVAADPTHVHARAALAGSEAERGWLGAAREAIAAAGGDASSDPVVALERARIAVLEAKRSGSVEDAASAVERLQRAIALAPTDPEPHAALARHLAATGEPGSAIPAFERARELGAWSPGLDLELAREYLERRDVERAVALLRPVAADLHGGRPSEQARELLEELESEG